MDGEEEPQPGSLMTGLDVPEDGEEDDYFSEGEEDGLEEEDAAEAAKILEQVQQDIDTLQKENMLLAAYLEHAQPVKQSTVAEEETKKKKKKGKNQQEEFKPLTAEEKNDIASNERERLQKAISKTKNDADQEIDEMKTLMDEIDERIAESKKETYEFKRDVIVGAENPRTGKTMAEKMLRFMEERLRARDTLAEKYRLKNASMKIQLAKMEAQLHQKEEMGEILHVVDFDQMKIENQQYLERIEERNNELLQLKITTGQTIQTLNRLKTELSELVRAGESTRRALSERAETLDKFKSDLASANRERRSAKTNVQRLQLEQEDVDQPEIIDYIRLKAEVQELEGKEADLKRKIEIAEMDQTRTNRILARMSMTHGSTMGKSPTHA